MSWLLGISKFLIGRYWNCGGLPWLVASMLWLSQRFLEPDSNYHVNSQVLHICEFYFLGCITIKGKEYMWKCFIYHINNYWIQLIKVADSKLILGFVFKSVGIHFERQNEWNNILGFLFVFVHVCEFIFFPQYNALDSRWVQ